VRLLLGRLFAVWTTITCMLCGLSIVYINDILVLLHGVGWIRDHDVCQHRLSGNRVDPVGGMAGLPHLELDAGVIEPPEARNAKLKMRTLLGAFGFGGLNLVLHREVAPF